MSKTQLPILYSNVLYTLGNYFLDRRYLYRRYVHELTLNTFEESGYTVDIINKPGNVGFPEAVETLIGEPRAVLIRELDTSRLLKISGWNINLGNQNVWKLDLLSFDSNIYLDNVKLKNSEISGTGIIYLGKNLEVEELKINGNFDINYCGMLIDKSNFLILNDFYLLK